MHFDAARALITLVFTTAMSAPIQDRGSYTHPGPAGIRRTQGSDDLPDCLNHERLGARNFALGLLASGVE
jgi:hypothetical protein